MERRDFMKACGVLPFAPLAFTKPPQGPIKSGLFDPDEFAWVNRENFHKLIVYHQYDFPLSNKLATAFQTLTEILLDSYRHKSILLKYHREDIIQECVLICYEKLKRFDPDKGKAFNYFSTIIISQLRQWNYVAKRNQYPELRKKYQQNLNCQTQCFSGQY